MKINKERLETLKAIRKRMLINLNDIEETKKGLNYAIKEGIITNGTLLLEKYNEVIRKYESGLKKCDSEISKLKDSLFWM